MREIKFRLWDLENRQMYNQLSSAPSFGQSENDRLVSFEDALFYEKDAFEIMQFTGLYDKNSKEIYEGDIVEINSSYLDKPIRSEVVYGGEEYPAFDLPNYDADTMNGFSAIYFGDDETIEVIGNIYENPELLEKEA